MKKATSGPKAKRRAKAKQKPAALIAAEAEIKTLKEELSDLQLLYDGTLEHAEAVEDQLAGTNLKLEGLSRKLAKYLSPQIYNSIFTGQQAAEISAKRKKLTIFFSDIADFTQTTDSLESEELTGLLNHYLTEMAKIALDYGATIDKYIGDAILAFFGDPDSRGVREDALACVKMGIAMQRRMRELQGEWMNVGTEKPLGRRHFSHTTAAISQSCRTDSPALYWSLHRSGRAVL
jgi:class 3 adenylate cyclase